MVERNPYGDPVVEMGLAVEACGVTKWFGETTALDEVDFTVLDGSVHGLLGPCPPGRGDAAAVRTHPARGGPWLGRRGGRVRRVAPLLPVPQRPAEPGRAGRVRRRGRRRPD